MESLVIIIVLFAPLIGGIAALIAKEKVETLSTLFILVSTLVVVYALFSRINYSETIEWLPGYSVSIKVDDVSLILILLVTLISTLVHLFSQEYMRSDAGKNRYFAKLGLFTFSMIGLLISDHLILLFVFWELVGLASYLLIGFWHKKDGIPSSARLSFMVNRIADVALLAGILMLTEKSLNISDFEGSWLVLPSILITLGAFGKSAQLPFSGWLTKAMVGPTPVSALIHAATMVAAGVYLLFRVSPFMHEDVLVFVALIGGFTALYGGICALWQHDIKKVLAYSTISQLGYMTIGIGVGSREASLFHLFTHGFFKAGLFLGAGAIIHFMHKTTNVDAQDMRNMGGLRNELPWTYRSFVVCAFALVGIPLFSGFMSKEGIIIAAWEWANMTGTWAYLVPDFAFITAFLTALYVGRMVLLVFWGDKRLVVNSTNFFEPVQMTLPLIFLAVGSLWFFHHLDPLAHESWLSTFWGVSKHESSDFAPIIVTFLSLLMAVSGLVLAYSFFKPGASYSAAYSEKTKHRFPLLVHGFYLTRVYESVGKGVDELSKFASSIDNGVLDRVIHFIAISGVVFSKVLALIDRFLVDGPINLLAYISRLGGKLLAGFSSRNIQAQITWLLIGLILILSLILFF